MGGGGWQRRWLALVTISSTSGVSRSSLSFGPRLSSVASEAIFLFMYASRYGPSKNVFMIVSLITCRISLKRRGMTPEPGRLHTRSKSILIATQLVMPPAKPKRPAARIQRAHSCPKVRAAPHSVPAVAALSSMPTSIMLNVAQLLMLPLFM